MVEIHEIPPEICPKCYRNKSEHAADCDYEQRLEQTKKAEGITPEFAEGVRSGKITFTKQMAEVNENLKKILETPLPRKLEYDKLPKSIGEISSTIKYCENIIEHIRYQMPMIIRHKELTMQVQVIADLSQEVKQLYFKILESPSVNKDEIDHLASKAHDLKLMVDEIQKNLNKSNK